MKQEPIIRTLTWKDNRVVMLDQRELPLQEVYREYEDFVSVAQAIETMVVRGAPAIGVAAAMGYALGAMSTGVDNFDAFAEKMRAVHARLARTRPTAVNLFWALNRMERCLLAHREKPVACIVDALKAEALAIYEEDLVCCRRLSAFGQELLNDGDAVLTHCNAGALATAGFGTALGVIYAAVEAGKNIHVFADETRPRFQGANLTAWELQKYGIRATLICDNMAASLMRSGRINKVIVGADRIARNGDVANKIGTYSVAVAAHHHSIPLYVAAPSSTIDLDAPNGTTIPIEERAHEEVTHIGRHHIAPTQVEVFNPAFDITPAELISAIVTERGVFTPPFSFE